MSVDPLNLILAEAGVLLIAFMKGAFGGGFAIVAIPLLSLAMDPIAAGALLAPLFIIMDLTALRYWKPATWSRPDLHATASHTRTTRSRSGCGSDAPASGPVGESVRLPRLRLTLEGVGRWRVLMR